MADLSLLSKSSAGFPAGCGADSPIRARVPSWRANAHALVALLVLLVFPSLYAQTAEPFAASQQSLSAKADALLAAEPVATPQAPVAVREQRWAGPGLGSAAARVELLRPVVEPILASHGVPAEMASAVILVESGGRPDALSPKGARGVWQLMPETARRYGLEVDALHDERTDPIKATHAAAGYLHDLYARFGDWKLALAAYNAGEANVTSAIFRTHSQDFDRLAGRLPQETRDYVPRVLARAGFASPLAVRPGGATVFAVSFP